MSDRTAMTMKSVASVLLLCAAFAFAIAAGKAHADEVPLAPSAQVGERASNMPAAPDASSPLAPFRQANGIIVAVLSQAGTAPSLSNPVYAKLVSRAFDISLLETVKDLPMMDMMGLCFQASGTQVVYMLHGIRKEDLDPWAIQLRVKEPVNTRVAILKVENYLQFQDELVAALGFGLACRKRELAELQTYLGHMPHDEMVAFRIGFPDFQHGLAELVSYYVTALRYPIRPENHQAVIDLLVGNIEPLAAGMNKASRRSAAMAVGQAMAADTSRQDREALKNIGQALKRADCRTVCAFH